MGSVGTTSLGGLVDHLANREPGIAWSAVMILLLPVLGLMIAVAGSSAGAEIYAAEGTIEVGTPASPAQVGFEENCTYPPEGQGVDIHVFELPTGFVGGGATFHVVGFTETPPPPPETGRGAYDLDVYFYTADCSFIEDVATEAPDETGKVPAQSSYVLAHLFTGAQTTACLYVGSASAGPCPLEGGGSTSPTQTSTATTTSTQSTTGEVSTSIETTRSKAKYLKPFTLSGRVTADESCDPPYTVSIRKQVFGANRSKVIDPRVGVGRDRTWKFQHRSKFSASYIAKVNDTDTCDGKASRPLEVRVRAKILVSLPEDCAAPQTLRGRVLPNHRGTPVRLQLRSGGKWMNIDQDRLNRKSRFIVQAPRCEGSYRLQWPPKGKKNIRGMRSFSF